MLEVDLRPLDDTDLPILLAWAHMLKIWEYLPTSRRSEILTWEEHNKWFHFKRNNRFDWTILLDDGKWKQRSVGMVHVIEIHEEYPEVGLYIGDVNLWGKGIGKRALQLVIGRMSVYSHIQGLHAIIHPDNKRSIRLFKSLGFKKVGEARKGQDRYECTFSRPSGPIPIHQFRSKLSDQPSPI